MKKSDKHSFLLLYAAACILLLLALLLWLGWRFTVGGVVETDLSALLPADKSLTAAEKIATARNDAALNHQLVLLVGADNQDAATAAADEVAHRWRASGLFTEVHARTVPDLTQWGQSLSALNVALLPDEAYRLLRDRPETFFKRRAQEIASPFAASFIPPDQDWLGLSAAAMTHLNFSDKVRWDAASGHLLVEDGQNVWVLLRAQLPEADGIINIPDKLLPLIRTTQDFAVTKGARLLLAGGAVFAAEGRRAAQQESRMMSSAGVLLTLLLLWAVFRSVRVPLLFVPAAGGLLAGMAATVAVFGHIHVLTLVIGTSLLGLLIDFPLHWLSKAVAPAWAAQRAMRQVLPTFAISLAVTVSGYALLLATPLPVLRQSAVFSVASLSGAFACTVFLLPLLFRRAHVRLAPWFVRFAAAVFRAGLSLKTVMRRPWAATMGVLLLAAGLWQSHWQDDIRQWVAMPQTWLQQAVQIGELTGMSAAGQFLLVEGDTPDAVLQRSHALNQPLHALQTQGSLDGFSSLGQWIKPLAQQRAAQQTLRALAERADSWQPMRDLGVPDAALRQALLDAAARAPLDLTDSLGSEIAQPYRLLWLGETGPARYAAMVRLFGVRDVAALHETVAGIDGVRVLDQPARLNRLFDQTKSGALWLKLASYGFALILLAWIFGMKNGGKILAVPLLAAVATTAVLGLAGQTVTLFSVFGLLLVSAIGVDYALYAQNPRIGATEKRCGIVLAAMTTMLSFALLAASGTPAVAGFGLSVALGVLFNVLFSSWLFDVRDASA